MPVIDEQLRVTIFSQIPPPLHGSSIMTEVLFLELIKAGIKVQLLNRNLSKSLLEIGRLTFRKAVNSVLALMRFTIAQIRFNPEVNVVFMAVRGPAFLLDACAALISYALNKKFIIYLHAVGFSGLLKRGWLYGQVSRVVMERANRIVVLGDHMRIEIESAYRAANCVVISNAVNSNQITQIDLQKLHLGVPNVSPEVLFLSNLIPSKGIFDFLETAKMLAARRPGTRFGIIGASADISSYEEIRQECKALNSRNVQVELFGALPRDEAMNLLFESRVLVFPSTYELEAQPMVLLEAMSLGIPIVAYDSPATKSIAPTEYESIVPVSDVEGLACQVLRLLDSPEAWQFASEACRRKSQANFSLEVFSARWTSLLYELRGS